VTALPPLNVVVVAYGSPDLLERCLTALGHELPVLVIDNSSSDEVREIAARDSCRYLDSGGNVGFAAAVNLALDVLGPKRGDVLLLNPDAQVGGDVARALQRTMRTDGNKRVACVSPVLSRDDGTAERVEWPFPTPGRAWLDAIGLGSVGRSTGFLIGAALVLRSEAIDAVGSFDERFFLYAEETDWQRRAVNGGWRTYVCRDLRARHSGAGTSSNTAVREATFHASVERYLRKWHGTIGWQTFRAGVLFGAAIRCVVGTKRAANRQRFVRYLRGPVRCSVALGSPL